MAEEQNLCMYPKDSFLNSLERFFSISDDPENLDDSVFGGGDGRKVTPYLFCQSKK